MFKRQKQRLGAKSGADLPSDEELLESLAKEIYSREPAGEHAVGSRRDQSQRMVSASIDDDFPEDVAVDESPNATRGYLIEALEAAEIAMSQLEKSGRSLGYRALQANSRLAAGEAPYTKV